MKKFFSRVLLFSVALTFAVSFSLIGIQSVQANEIDENFIDYADELKLDMSSETKKTEVTIASLIDGDTTHFDVDNNIVPEKYAYNGILKARYLGVDTPESTGTVEPYGVQAKEFTNSKLIDAVSIIVESDDGEWHLDSTSKRVLSWIWYKSAAGDDYRNLNVEILQNGFARNRSTGTRYADVCLKANMQAQKYKLKCYSGERDPKYYYGDAIELTLKEVRLNKEAYVEKKVAFNGIITHFDGSNGFYIEEYDPENAMNFGIYCFMGFGLSGETLRVLAIGNEVRIVGTLMKFHESWQVSDLKNYNPFDPDNPDTVNLVSEGNEISYSEITAEALSTKKTTEIENIIENPLDLVHNMNLGEGEEPIPLVYSNRTVTNGDAILNTAVSLKNLTVQQINTTKNGGNNDGAMTLICKDENGTTVKLRTTVFHDGNGNLVTEKRYEGKTIDVKGFVDFFMDNYQVKIVAPKYIEIHGEEALRAEAADLDEKILTLPSGITDENYEATKNLVSEIRQAYESLSDTGKGLLENARMIKSTENKIKTYENKKNKARDDKDKDKKGCGSVLDSSLFLFGLTLLAGLFIVQKRK